MSGAPKKMGGPLAPGLLVEPGRRLLPGLGSPFYSTGKAPRGLALAICGESRVPNRRVR